MAIGLRAVIAEYRPRIVAFTGKRAAQQFVGRPVDYGGLLEQEGETRLFVLPSPSGAACRYWNVAPWQALARLREELAAVG